MKNSKASNFNKIIDGIVYDVGSILNAKYTDDPKSGNRELSSSSLQLSGLNIREKAVKHSDYAKAKAFFEGLGVGNEAASSLAMTTINASIYGDKSVGDIISDFKSRGILFFRDQYLKINRIRKPTSQLYSWIDVDNCDDSYMVEKAGLFCREEELPPEPPIGLFWGTFGLDNAREDTHNAS